MSDEKSSTRDQARQRIREARRILDTLALTPGEAETLRRVVCAAALAVDAGPAGRAIAAFLAKRNG